ncbi:MAG: IS4 family transposase [Phycisphaerae bacterium]
MKNNVLIKLFEKAGLTLEKINILSVQTGFIKRCRQIKAVEFLVYMITEAIRGCVSCNDLAAVIEAKTGTTASRQAYHQKMNRVCLLFFEAIAAIIMNSKASASVHSKFRRFKRILVQDSTVIKLPSRLMDVFSGVRNAHIKVCNARIQSVFDLLCGSFTQWSIDTYSKNDQAAASELMIKVDDLILRDRGYFIVAEFGRIIKAGADFISRYRHKTTLCDPQTGQEINLLRLLDTQRTVDQRVLIGKDSKIEVRLIAMEVSQETAGRRRQKAKEEWKGHNPGQEILFLMGWTIFITSLTNSEITVDDFVELYGLRWKIETIFKTWKSHMSFDKIHIVSEIQLRLILISRFIAIMLFYEKIYSPLLQRVCRESKKIVSLMKLMRYISRNFKAIPHLLNAVSGSVKCLRSIERYCTYDTRKRLNFIEKEIGILTVIEVTTLLT